MVTIPLIESYMEDGGTDSSGCKRGAGAVVGEGEFGRVRMPFLWKCRLSKSGRKKVLAQFFLANIAPVGQLRVCVSM